jgi:DMSO/TMAO reductase YedYZ molybdopterin-dependent catalytic subunit
MSGWTVRTAIVLEKFLIRRERLTRTIQISSAAGLIGLLLHYLAFYVVHTPLLTDQISEWMMARTPSRYAVPILLTLGGWAKPWAATGALATLGFCLFLCRALGVYLPARAKNVSVVVASTGIACLLDYSIGYASVSGALAFWVPAVAIVTFVPTTVGLPSTARRNFLVEATRFTVPIIMTGGVVAVAAESYFRELALEKRAVQPEPLFPFQPPLAYRDFGDGLVRHEITRVSEFYGMSKNTVDPVVDLDSWRLRITMDGKLLRSLRFGELLGLSRKFPYVTLRCISNTLQSDLMGTAQWAGIHLSQLLDRGVLPKAIIEAAFIGVDGHDDSVKLDYAYGPDTFLALGMNGKTLSRTHGFPVRLLAPSYYGCRNVKWLGEIRLVSKPYYGTWQRLGYTKEPLIHIASHVDHLRRDGSYLQFGGVSFAGTRCIEAVRVRANGGPWQAARLEPALSPFTWTRWIAQLQTPAESRIEVNAQDETGAWQELAPGNPFPNGPSGPTIIIAHT